MINQWLDNITLAGSDNYYALLKIEPEKKHAIKILLALFEILITMPFVLSEDAMVHAKLRWWKEELIKTQQQHASHPLSMALEPIMEKYHLNYNALLQSISAIENIVQNCQFPTEQSLRDFYTHTYGIRERIIAKILLPESKQYSEAIHHLAYCLGLIDNLKHLRQRAIKTYAFFSDEEARELGIDKNLVLTMKISEPLKKLLARQIEKAQEHFQLGSEKLTSNGVSPQRGLKPSLIRVSLGLKWCELVRDEKFSLFTHQIELTPLRKWWYTR
ncbi:MAG: squalene/phytoene synthase family protein [Pseudomonadota bacterium]